MSKPYTYRLNNKEYHSEILPIGAFPIEFTIDHTYRHCFAGVEYYSDANGENVVIPDDGSETYTLKTPVQPNAFQPFQGNVIPASTPGQVSWGSNALKVRVELTSITGSATHARLFIATNIS